MAPVPHRIRVRQHSGSTQQEIEDEPEWGSGHLNRIGFLDRHGRITGLTHAGDERSDQEEFKQKAAHEIEELKSKIKKGGLVNFRDVIKQQEVWWIGHFTALLNEWKGNTVLFVLGLPPAPTQRSFSRLAICS